MWIQNSLRQLDLATEECDPVGGYAWDYAVSFYADVLGPHARTRPERYRKIRLRRISNERQPMRPATGVPSKLRSWSCEAAREYQQTRYLAPTLGNGEMSPDPGFTDLSPTLTATSHNA